MMTLIAVAISVAYIYSVSIVFGVQGKMFFWELASLIDIMLLGHWIEMRSIMAAGVLYNYGIVLSPAVAAIFMSLSTVICAVNAKRLTINVKREK